MHFESFKVCFESCLTM